MSFEYLMAKGPENLSNEIENCPSLGKDIDIHVQEA
jgi:hypothetical protein